MYFGILWIPINYCRSKVKVCLAIVVMVTLGDSQLCDLTEERHL